MKRNMMAAVILGAWGILFPAATQADPPTAEAVLERAVKAQYGEKYSGLKSLRATGTFAIPAQGMSGKLTLLSKAPDKTRLSIELPGMGKIEEGSDGKIAWASDPMAGLREKTGTERTQALFSADFYGEANWRKRYKKVTFKGEETLDGRKVHVLTLEAEGLEPMTESFDAETGLPCRQQMTADTAQGKMPVDARLSDYRAIEGEAFGKIVMAYKNVQSVAAMSQEMVIDKFEPNVEIDDAVFAMPKEESTAATPAAEADLTLPIHPFADVKEGDWCVLVLAIADPSGGGGEDKKPMMWKVGKVEADAVTWSACAVTPAGLREKPIGSFPRKAVETFRGFLQFLFQKDQGQENYARQKVEDDKRTVNGKEFACKKISAVIVEGDGREAEVAAWFSSEVSGLHLVCLAAKEAGTVAIELAGYGNGEKATWGKTVSEVDAGLKGSHDGKGDPGK